MASGFVVIHRGLFNNPMLPDAVSRDFFTWLICQAAWERKTVDVNGKPFVLERGQLWTSIPHIKRELQLTDQNVRTLLERLETWQAIQQQTNRRGRIITICNYSKYQDVTERPNRQVTGRVTGSQQAGNRQVTASKQIEPFNNTLTGAEKSAHESLTELVWKTCPAKLTKLGMRDGQARSFIGKCLKGAKPSEVMEAIDKAARNVTPDPVPYITNVLKGAATRLSAAERERRELDSI